MAAFERHCWKLEYDDDASKLSLTPMLGPEQHRGCIRSHDGAWIRIAEIRAVYAWIEERFSGVDAILGDDARAGLMHYDSGNIDWTATWNEYLYDGCWAYGAGRQLAGELGVPYIDAWTEGDGS